METILNVFKVNENKPIAYENRSNIIHKYGNNIIDDIKKWTIKHDLKYVEFSEHYTFINTVGKTNITTWGGGIGFDGIEGSIYVYHEMALKKHIEKYKNIYINQNIPTTVNEFIEHVYKYAIMDEAREVLALAFGNKFGDGNVNLNKYFKEYFEKFNEAPEGLSIYYYTRNASLMFFKENNLFDARNILEKIELNYQGIFDNVNETIFNNIDNKTLIANVFEDVFYLICVKFHEMLADFESKKNKDDTLHLNIVNLFYCSDTKTITCSYHKTIGKTFWGK